MASGPYAIDDTVGSRVRPDPDLGVTAGTSLYNPLEAPNYLSQRKDVAVSYYESCDILVVYVYACIV